MAFCLIQNSLTVHTLLPNLYKSFFQMALKALSLTSPSAKTRFSVSARILYLKELKIKQEREAVSKVSRLWEWNTNQVQNLDVLHKTLTTEFNRIEVLRQILLNSQMLPLMLYMLCECLTIAMAAYSCTSFKTNHGSHMFSCCKRNCDLCTRVLCICRNKWKMYVWSDVSSVSEPSF